MNILLFLVMKLPLSHYRLSKRKNTKLSIFNNKQHQIALITTPLFKIGLITNERVERLKCEMLRRLWLKIGAN